MAAACKGVRLETRIASLPDVMRAKQQTGKRKTPFLITGDEWITDSTTICAWLESRFGGPSLLPDDEAERAECLLLEDWADEALNSAAEPWLWAGDGRVPWLNQLCVDEQTHKASAILFRVMRGYQKKLWLKRVGKHGGVEGARQMLCSQLDLVEGRLGGKSWLFGDKPSVADFAIAGQLANCFRFRCSSDLEQRPATAAMVQRAAALLPWWNEQRGER